jgi:hypothetical protein
MQLQNSNMDSMSASCVMRYDSWDSSFKRYLQYHNADHMSLRSRKIYVCKFDADCGVRYLFDSVDGFVFDIVDATKLMHATLKWELVYTTDYQLHI